jgi:thioredoxin-related protein
LRPVRSHTAVLPSPVRVLLAGLLAGAVLFAARPLFAAELIMFEQFGCEWCEVWNAEVGTIYAKTDEGRRASLRRVDIDDDRPADLAGIRGVRYTPTFVVMDRGREVGRILGYPGEDMFYGLLNQILKKVPKPTT